jgi:hypothetical protein
MSQLMPYSVAVDDQTITIRADRTVFDSVALTKLLDYLSLESIRRRSQATQAEVDTLAKDVNRKAWERLQRQLMLESASS